MARPDQIPTDLTLEIGTDVTPEQFMTLTRAFFGYVNEVAHMVCHNGSEPSWRVEVRQGSALIGISPSVSVHPEILRTVYAKIAKGANAIAGGDVEGAGLSVGATKHLKLLSDTVEGNKDKPLSIRLWVEREPIEVSSEISKIIREDWRTTYSDYGTVEGRLKAIQDMGNLRLEIKDDALGCSVKCTVPEDMLDTVFENFRKRVEISGLIHYRRNGTPLSIEAIKIEALPNDDELPTIADVRGLLRAAG